MLIGFPACSECSLVPIGTTDPIRIGKVTLPGEETFGSPETIPST
jgi:hypothetical protein